jgi:hypothetical protein
MCQELGTILLYFLRGTWGQELVVLRMHGDKAICATVDRKTNLVDPKFFILKVADGLKQPLRSEFLGRLRPREVAQLTKQGRSDSH